MAKRIEKIWKIISKEKEMLLKKIKKNYKRDLIEYLNHQAQHQTMQDQNWRYTGSYHPDKNESYDQFNKIQSKKLNCYHY